MRRGSWLVILIFYFISFFSCLFKNTKYLLSKGYHSPVVWFCWTSLHADEPSVFFPPISETLSAKSLMQCASLADPAWLMAICCHDQIRLLLTFILSVEHSEWVSTSSLEIPSSKICEITVLLHELHLGLLQCLLCLLHHLSSSSQVVGRSGLWVGTFSVSLGSFHYSFPSSSTFLRALSLQKNNPDAVFSIWINCLQRFKLWSSHHSRILPFKENGHWAIMYLQTNTAQNLSIQNFQI